MIREKEIKPVINSCINVINEAAAEDTLNVGEIANVLAQLLILCGASLSEKEVNPYSMDIKELYNTYYNDDKNDIGLGLVLNGASLMTAITDNIKESVCDETAQT